MTSSIQNEDLNNAILSWISTFNDLSSKPDNMESLCDGVILGEILNIIAPSVIDKNKLSRDVGGNWALALNNLTYLMDGIENFYINTLGKSFDKNYVDLLEIAKNSDKDQLYNLIELVLGAAVQCEYKEAYISPILNLDETCQTALMYLIDKVLNKFHTEQGDNNAGSNNPSLILENNPQNAFENFKASQLSPTYGGSFMFKVDNEKRQLIAKLEELENENIKLLQEIKEGEKDKEGLKNKISELSLELSKKNEEIKKVVGERQAELDKMVTQELQEELENELKLKEFRITELNRMIEELNQKHEIDLTNLKDELDEQKRKMNQLAKMESTAEFYKQKYEDYTRMAAKVSDLEAEIESQKGKNDELQKTIDNLNNKMNMYKEKLEHEKTTNISLELEITKKNNEIESMKLEKKRLELTNSDFEAKIDELNKILDKVQRENEETGQKVQTENVLNQLAGDFHELIANLEKENESLKNERRDVEKLSNEKEILEKENLLLKHKLKEIESENQNLKEKVAASEDVKIVEKLNRENFRMKEEMEKLKKGQFAHAHHQRAVSHDANPTVDNKAEGEISLLRKQLNETLEKLKKRRDEQVTDEVLELRSMNDRKDELINELSERVNLMENSIQKAKRLEEELDMKNIQIKEFIGEIDAMKGIIIEVGDQKEAELKLLSSVVQELAHRNVELEKEIAIKEEGIINAKPKQPVN